MPFPYTRQTHVDGQSFSAAKANVMEAGIELAGVFGTSSTPPGSPSDGMLWRYSPSTGVNWLFQYDSSLATYKWVFLGGPDLYTRVATDQGTASTTYVDLATVGPSVTLARAGIYNVQYGCQMYNSGSGNINLVGLSVAGGTPNDATQGESARHRSTAVTTIDAGAWMHHQITAAATNVVKLQYRVTAGTGNFTQRVLRIVPVQII